MNYTRLSDVLRYTEESKSIDLEHTDPTELISTIHPHVADHIKGVLYNIPLTALTRLKGRLHKIVVYPNATGVREKYYDLEGNEGNVTPPHQYRTFDGFYDPSTKTAHVSKNIKPKDFAHELAHALDINPKGDLYELSHTDEFRYHWSQELKHGQLSTYGASEPEEGFAEFIGWLYTHPNAKEVAKKKFPGLTEYAERHGLI